MRAVNAKNTSFQKTGFKEKCSKEFILKSLIVFFGLVVFKYLKISLARDRRIFLRTSVNLWKEIDSFGHLLIMRERGWERQRYLIWEKCMIRSMIETWCIIVTKLDQVVMERKTEMGDFKLQPSQTEVFNLISSTKFPSWFKGERERDMDTSSAWFIPPSRWTRKKCNTLCLGQDFSLIWSKRTEICTLKQRSCPFTKLQGNKKKIAAPNHRISKWWSKDGLFNQRTRWIIILQNISWTIANIAKIKKAQSLGRHKSSN